MVGWLFFCLFSFFNRLQFEKNRLRIWFSVFLELKDLIFSFFLHVSLIFRLIYVISEIRYLTVSKGLYYSWTHVRILLILMRILTQCFNLGIHTWVILLLSTYCVSGTVLNILKHQDSSEGWHFTSLFTFCFKPNKQEEKWQIMPQWERKGVLHSVWAIKV